MSRDWALRLADIREAIGRIQTYVESFDYAMFCADSKTQDAAIRNLEVIGEAARVLLDEIKMQSSQIEWRKNNRASQYDLAPILWHKYRGRLGRRVQQA